MLGGNTVNRITTRALLTLGGVASVSSFVYAANPRIVAWNQTSNAIVIAQQRAATCTKVNATLTPGSRAMLPPANGSPAVPMTPGTLICDRLGNTAEVTTGGRVQYIRSAPPEILNKALDARQLTPIPSYAPIPSASPVPPPLAH